MKAYRWLWMMMQVTVILLVVIMSYCSCQTTTPEQHATCNEDTINEITDFYSCVRHDCLVNWRRNPWECSTYTEIPALYKEYSVAAESEMDKYTECQDNSDCMLVNVNYRWRCCYEGFCELEENGVEPDAKHSKNWVAINRMHYLERQNELCSFYKHYGCTLGDLDKNSKCFEKLRVNPKTFGSSVGSHYATCDRTSQQIQRNVPGRCIKTAYKKHDMSLRQIVLVFIMMLSCVAVMIVFFRLIAISEAPQADIIPMNLSDDTSMGVMLEDDEPTHSVDQQQQQEQQQQL